MKNDAKVEVTAADPHAGFTLIEVEKATAKLMRQTAGKEGLSISEWVAARMKEAARLAAQSAAQEGGLREAAQEILVAFAEGVVWNDEQRAAYERLDALLSSGPTAPKSICDECGASYPTAPAGNVHKCGRCEEGRCIPTAPEAPFAPITSHEIIRRGGGDPDAPFAVGPFPPEMREASPNLQGNRAASLDERARELLAAEFEASGEHGCANDVRRGHAPGHCTPPWMDEALRAIIAALQPSERERRGAIDDIAAERQRQIEDEGWTPEHDDGYAVGSLSAAAACYALGKIIVHDGQNYWPWHPRWWKPKDRRRDLIRAGALIVAEIERLDRSTLDGRA